MITSKSDAVLLQCKYAVVFKKKVPIQSIRTFKFVSAP